MATIRLGTAINIQNFQSLSAALHNADAKFAHLIDAEALSDEFGRFRVWSGNLGALQKGHSSLDYRLRDSPLLSSNALRFLKELEDNLSEAIAIVTGRRLPFEQQAKPEDTEEEEDDFFSEDEDDDSEQSAPKAELEQRFREVVDIIDNLYKLSVRIRTPTIRTRSLKAASYRPKDPDTGVDIFEQYASFDLHHVQEFVNFLRASQGQPEQDDGSTLVERLAKAITLRRRQFKYWKRHRDKLGTSTVLEEPSPLPQPLTERPEAPQRHDTLEAHMGNPILATLKEASSEKTGKTVLSGTEATQHHKSLDEIVDSKSVTSYATTVRDLTGRGVELPSPPKAADGEKDFECPYCFIICPARYGRGRSWRTHLLQDLQPYVCTYPECDGPNQLFRSRREWSEHEASHRKAWRCPEHPNAVYKLQTGLEDHLRQSHTENFPNHQLESIVKVGETSTIDLRAKCPICLVNADMEGGLQNHIANHLERLASFALPKDVETADDNSDGGSSVASRGKTATTGSSQNLSGVSFCSNESHKAGPSMALDPAVPEGTSNNTQNDQTTSDPKGDTQNTRVVLSAEALNNLPDASQRRLDMLLSDRTHEDTTLEEHINEDDFDIGEDESDLEERGQFLRNLTLALTGAPSVRCKLRSGLWRGYAIFQDDTSATRALESFDSTKFPGLRLRQDMGNLAVLKFSLLISGTHVPIKPLSTTQNEDGSVSSSSKSYGERADGDIPPSILSASDIPTLRSLYRSRKLLQRDQGYAPNDTYNQIVSFCFYDLTRLKVDAIVNSANRKLTRASAPETLNYRIHRAAGPGLRRDTKLEENVKEGQVRLTPGHNLPSTYVIHAVRPHYAASRGGIDKSDILKECYRAALKTAMDHGIKSIAFPCLAAGGCGFPSRAAAKLALQEVRDFLDHSKGHTFEKIVFCVYNGSDERAYKDYFPVFFPPTQGDLENAEPPPQIRTLDSVASQLQDVYLQVEAIAQGLDDFRENVADFPHRVIDEIQTISFALRSLTTHFRSSEEPGKNFSSQSLEDIDLICTVLQGICGGITEIIEQAKYTDNVVQPTYKTIWDDYQFHFRSSKGLDFQRILEICQDFLQSLDDVIARGGIEPYEMRTMRVKLGSYRLKHLGETHQGVRNLFDEVMYSREFQKDAALPTKTGTIKVHAIPSLARLYQIGEMRPRPTTAIPDSRLNYMVCLTRNDITRLEVDAIVNSTDMGFSGMGTLDLTVFKKGGQLMQRDCANFGICKEGDVRLTSGYELPCKHVIHTIPPDTYRKNSKDVLRKIYKEILHLASSIKVASVAIPAIGTGMLNYPARDCAALAMEEVKRFLEAAEPTSSLEKIIFCVFGSNDEFIYKSLLPIHFPPTDININKALSSDAVQDSIAPQAQDTSHSAKPSTPRQRTFFDYLGDALRNVRLRSSARSDKQPAASISRSPNAGEEKALTDFEAHATSCATCSNIGKLYAENGDLCADGYGQAQGLLQYLHMEADHAIYSNNDEEGQRVKVDISRNYPISLDLITTVEKSFQDEHRTMPFVSVNMPYASRNPRIDQPESSPLPPGVTVHHAEVTIPVEQERFVTFAEIFGWSDDINGWESVQPRSWCRLVITPHGLGVYEDRPPSSGRGLLLSIRLNLFSKIDKVAGSNEVTIDDFTLQYSRLKTWRRFKIGSPTASACDELLDRLKDAQGGHEPQPREERYRMVDVFRWDEDTKSWAKVYELPCAILITPGKLQILESDVLVNYTASIPALLSLELYPNMSLRKPSDVDIIVEGRFFLQESRIDLGKEFMLRSSDAKECDTLYELIDAARKANTAYTFD